MSYFWNRVESKRLPGETFAEFARRVGIPCSSLWAYHGGRIPQRTQTYRRLAVKLGVDVRWLTFGGWTLAEMREEAQRRGIDVSELPYTEERPFLENERACLQ